MAGPAPLLFGAHSNRTLFRPPDQARAPCSVLPEREEAGGSTGLWPRLSGELSGVPCPRASARRCVPGLASRSPPRAPAQPQTFLTTSPRAPPRPGSWLPETPPGGSDLTWQRSVLSLRASAPPQPGSSAPAALPPKTPPPRGGGPAPSRRGGPSGCLRGGSRGPTRVSVLLLFFEGSSKVPLSRKGPRPFSGARGRMLSHPHWRLPAPTGLGHPALS